jgi:hypothetical protein
MPGAIALIPPAGDDELHQARELWASVEPSFDPAGKVAHEWVEDRGRRWRRVGLARRAVVVDQERQLEVWLRRERRAQGRNLGAEFNRKVRTAAERRERQDVSCCGKGAADRRTSSSCSTPMYSVLMTSRRLAFLIRLCVKATDEIRLKVSSTGVHAAVGRTRAREGAGSLTRSAW